MLKIGLVGVGYLGSRHLEHLLRLPGVTVSGIWDTDAARLTDESARSKVYGAQSLEDLLERSDAIDVVAPTTTHAEIGLEVIEAGKSLFIEKPICSSTSEAALLIDRAKSKNVVLQVGHIERFNRAVRALNNIRVKPRFIEAHRLAPWNPRGVDVAVVHDLMIHDLDLILSFANSRPEHVHANGVGVVTNSVDIATARIEFSDGMVANVTASRISLKKMRKLRMFGENEYIALDMSKGTCEYVGVADDLSSLPAGSLPLGEMTNGTRKRALYRRFLEAEQGDALALELASFRDAVVSGTDPPVTGDDGLKALELAERVTSVIMKQ